MSDKYLLKAMMNRQRFLSLHKSVPRDMFSSITLRVLDSYADYYQKYPEHDEIDVEALSTLMKLKKNQTSEETVVINRVLEGLREDVPEDVLNTTIDQLEELAFSGKASALLQAYQAGKEIDITYELQNLAALTRQRMSVQVSASWADGDVWDYIQADADDSGYVLDMFPDFAENIKGLNAGDNVGVCAPTDKGKTSALCRIAVSLAIQEFKLHGENYRPVLYCVNEGMAERITPRVYQTALSCTRAELWQAGSDGSITKKYEKVVGHRDAIRLVNIHGMSVSQVARVIEQHNPFLVITDMTGRIKANTAGVSNDIKQLEDIWDDFRGLAAIHKFIHIGTAQISAEGMDTLYPPLTAVQNSKVGIQTTWDLAIFIGALQTVTPETELLRGISTPKNKLSRSGKRSLLKTETYFQPEKNIWNLS